MMPPDPRVGDEARDCISRLICDPQDRLTAEEIRLHPFFKGLDFKRLREMEPPIRPVVNGPLDTSNFDDFCGADAQYGISSSRHQVVNDPSLFAFHDYGYRRDLEAKKPSVAAALNSAVGVGTKMRTGSSGADSLAGCSTMTDATSASSSAPTLAPTIVLTGARFPMGSTVSVSDSIAGNAHGGSIVQPSPTLQQAQQVQPRFSAIPPGAAACFGPHFAMAAAGYPQTGAAKQQPAQAQRTSLPVTMQQPTLQQQPQQQQQAWCAVGRGGMLPQSAACAAGVRPGGATMPAYSGSVPAPSGAQGLHSPS